MRYWLDCSSPTWLMLGLELGLGLRPRFRVGLVTLSLSYSRASAFCVTHVGMTEVTTDTTDHNDQPVAVGVIDRD